MSDDVSSDPQQWQAAQNKLDSSRGNFTHQAPVALATLESAQTAAKWGEESGPVAARQQYTESITDMQQQVVQYNADLLAFIDAMTKTRESFTGNELESQQAASSMLGMIDAGQGEAAELSKQQIKASVETAERAKYLLSLAFDPFNQAVLPGVKAPDPRLYYLARTLETPQTPPTTPQSSQSTGTVIPALTSANDQTWSPSPLTPPYFDPSKPGTVGHPDISTCPAGIEK